MNFRIGNDWDLVKKLFLVSDDWTGYLKLAALALGIAFGYLFDTEAKFDAALGAFILMLLDTVTGIMCAFKEGTPRTSARFSRVLVKTFEYLAVITVAAIVERVIFPAIPLVVGALCLIIATEGTSILENVEKLGGGRFRGLKKVLGRVIEDDGKEPKSRARRRS